MIHSFLRSAQSGCNLKPSKFIPIIASGSNLNLAPLPPVGTDYAFLAHPSYWASDASHLVPCAAGDAIQWWKDAVTGTWYQQATSGNRFIARQDSTTKKWYAEGTGSQYQPWVDLTGVSGTNLCFGAAYQFYSNVTYCQLISNILSGTPVRELRQSGVSAKIQIVTNNNASTITDPTAYSLNTDYRHIAVMSGTTTIYRNGTSAASGADTTTSTLGPTTVGGRTTSYQINGRIYGVLIAKNQNANVPVWDAALHNYCTA